MYHSFMCVFKMIFQYFQTSNSICTFVILGERCLYALNDNGILKFMKKFDFEPMCAHAYLIGWYYGKIIVIFMKKKTKI